MRSFSIVALLISLFISIYSISAGAIDHLTLFTTSEAAQQHCIYDEVVWLNTKSGIWHAQGGRWFGNTKNGAYVCKKEAAAAGNRASLNG